MFDLFNNCTKLYKTLDWIFLKYKEGVNLKEGGNLTPPESKTF